MPTRLHAHKFDKRRTGEHTRQVACQVRSVSAGRIGFDDEWRQKGKVRLRKNDDHPLAAQRSGRVRVLTKTLNCSALLSVHPFAAHILSTYFWFD